MNEINPIFLVAINIVVYWIVWLGQSIEREY